METTLLPEGVLDGQIAVTNACIDAATNLVQHQGRLMQAVLEVPRISVEDAKRVSRTIFSIGFAWSLSAAMFIVGSFPRLSESTTSSSTSAPAPKKKPPTNTRRPKAIAAA